MSGSSGLIRRGALAVALVGLLAAAIPAWAGPQDRLDANQERLEEIKQQIAEDEEREDELSSKIRKLDEERARVEDSVEALDGQLSVLTDRINTLTDRLVVTQQRLSAVSQELRRLERKLAGTTEVFENRAIATYMAGPSGALDGILSAESFGDLVDRFEYYESALESDTELIAEIDNLRADADLKRDEIEETELQLAEAKLELEEDRTELSNARAERADVLAQREAVIQEKDGLLASVQAHKGGLEEKKSAIEKDSARLEAMLLAQASANPAPPPSGPLPKGGGQMLWPAAGSLTSPYGYRIHPIFGYSRLHSGIDIGAGYGAPVIAAEAGTVAYVGEMSGYGNVVVVDHGAGVATTYNHLSAFSVSDGSTVDRGQTIAAIGCTGWCTGPQLHFEVRINGTPVDPMPYVS